MQDIQQIVVDGEQRLRSSPEYAAACRQVECAVRAEFADELVRAGLLRRLLLRVQIRRRIRRGIRLLTPRDACYFALDGRRAVTPIDKTGDR